MAKKVQISQSSGPIQLPGLAKVLRAGDVATLSDVAYASIPAALLGSTVLLIGSTVDNGPQARALDPVSGLVTTLRRGNRSATVALYGDSTGDDLAYGGGPGADEWFSILGGLVGAKFPSYGVWRRRWNDGSQNWDAPTFSSGAGSLYGRYATFANGELHYPGAVGVTGDLDIRIKVAPASWTPSGDQVLAAKWDSTGGRSWLALLKANGTVSFRASTDGQSATAVEKLSTVAVPGAVNGQPLWLRFVYDVDNGASGNDVKFYYGSDGANWTQIGATVTTAGIGSVFAGTSAYQVGAFTAGLSNPLSGSVYWIEVRNGVGGYSVVPPLMDDWEQGSSSTASNTVLYGGAPVLLMHNGAQSGMNISYFDLSTRRPKLYAPAGQCLIYLSTGHNDNQASRSDWISAYSAWVADIKAALPGVPIVCVTQNPATAPRILNDIDVRAARTAALMQWAASQAGVYGVDTYPAFTDLAHQVNNADGVHPTHTGDPDVGSGAPGEVVWANYVYQLLFSSLDAAS